MGGGRAEARPSCSPVATRPWQSPGDRLQKRRRSRARPRTGSGPPNGCARTPKRLQVGPRSGKPSDSRRQAVLSQSWSRYGAEAYIVGRLQGVTGRRDRGMHHEASRRLSGLSGQLAADMVRLPIPAGRQRVKGRATFFPLRRPGLAHLQIARIDSDEVVAECEREIYKAQDIDPMDELSLGDGGGSVPTPSI